MRLRLDAYSPAMQAWIRLSRTRLGENIGDLLAEFQRAPAAQLLLQRVEQGGLFSCAGVHPAARPFLAALLRRQFPHRAVVLVAESGKVQEAFQEELHTWLGSPTLFFPAWEVLPGEARLPHADVISERLETGVALSLTPPSGGAAAAAPMVVTHVVALMQRTLSAAAVRERTLVLRRGDRSDPLDLIERLEGEG